MMHMPRNAQACLGGVSEASWRRLGGVSEVSWRCLGGVLEASRRCLGGVLEVPRREHVAGCRAISQGCRG
eukprot:36729-Lingulodinium_polyedra.AAC.1